MYAFITGVYMSGRIFCNTGIQCWSLTSRLWIKFCLRNDPSSFFPYKSISFAGNAGPIPTAISRNLHRHQLRSDLNFKLWSVHYQYLSIHTVKLDRKQTVTFPQRRQGRKLKPVHSYVVVCVYLFLLLIWGGVNSSRISNHIWTQFLFHCSDWQKKWIT